MPRLINPATGNKVETSLASEVVQRMAQGYVHEEDLVVVQEQHEKAVEPVPSQDEPVRQAGAGSDEQPDPVAQSVADVAAAGVDNN